MPDDTTPPIGTQLIEKPSPDSGISTRFDMAALIDKYLPGTARRLGVFLAGMAVPFLNQKFGWGLDTATIGIEMGGVLTYVVQSAINEMHARHVEAKVETSAQAAAVFNKAAP